MDDAKKSIVNYDDDEDDNETLKPKEPSSKDLQKMSKPNRKEEGSRKRHSDHHRHHSRHFSSSSSPSKSHHRHRNSNEKRTYRHQSPSPPRSSRKDGRHSYSRGSCRKSKFDSPSRESSHTHRHKKHRSRTPPRKTEVKNVKHEEAASTKVCNNSKPVKLESIQKVDPIKHMLPPAPPKQIVVPNLPDLSRFIENSHQLLANSSASKKSEQEKKRKLLWGDSKKTTETSSKPSTNVWTSLQFQGERGSKMTEKFRKLMGIKEGNDTTKEQMTSKDDNKDINQKQATLFKDLDEQYSIARMSTHTHRGVGLGFSNHRLL